MSVTICCGIFIIFISKCLPAYGQLEDQKSSLTFVIDDTMSMWNDIQQVKSGASAIFDTVINSNASQIENFVLVTFNDPGISTAKITNDEDHFRNALDAITVHGGVDCPEMAMKGIEEALTKSLPGSYIYVFTDASAKDYSDFERIKSIALKKQSQVVFVLTGLCGGTSDPDYRVYHQLAGATSGQVFHLNRDEVRKILDYVAETVKSRKTVITSKKFSPGYGKTFKYPVDDKTKDIVIAVSGTKPKVEVTKPDGSEAKTKDILKTEKISVVKVSDTEPGVHTAKVGSESETTAVVTGVTTVNFQHGFSPFKPTSIKDTVTKPISERESYLAIELSNKDNDVELQTVEILDMDENIIFERPLYIVNDNFYVTEPTIPPNDIFKIAVKGYNTKSKATLRRISLTPIEPQKPIFEKTVNKGTTVIIEGEPLRNITYGNALQLKCKVNGYPKPTVTWIDESSGATLPSMDADIDLPYDYISVLNLEQVKKNTTYQCRAFNDYGEDKKSVAVAVDTKFTVVNISKDTSIDYEDEGKLYCFIDAFPPSHVTWYLNGEEMKEDIDLEKSSDGSVLTITSMAQKFEGKYICEAKNEFNRKIFFINLSMSGTASPKIDAIVTELHVSKEQNIDINCRVIEGIPQPSVRWFFKHKFAHEFHQIREESDVVHISDAKTLNAGTYICEAYNIFGKDVREIDLIVEYPPTIKDGTKSVKALEGKRIKLTCNVDGVPKPDVKWTFNGVVIRNSFHQRIYRDNTLSFKASLHNTGTYSCEAVNRLGATSKTVLLTIYGQVSIEPPIESRLEKAVGSSLTLPCKASGYPRPSIKWIFMSSHSNYSILRPSDVSGTLHIPRLQVDQSGYYVCIAKDFGGTANITYEVQVVAPPSIVKMSSGKTHTAGIGDLVLRIPCNATGNPKPTITWAKDGFNIASGTVWHNIEGDGTLVIMNVDDFSDGIYVCTAQNSLGTDTDIFQVNVLPYPKTGPPTKTVYVEYEKPATIDCDIPHKRTDLLRWYKDTKIVATGELNINNVKMSDDGLYTCRVSTFSGATSATKLVKVGYKPSFITEEDENVDFAEGMEAYLSCAAIGEPKPKVTWWHNTKKLDVTNMMYIFSMSVNDLGQYSCAVTNTFGTITRNFEITTRECLLNIDTMSPTVVSFDLRFGTFDNNDNTIRLPRGQDVLLYCPSGFVDYRGKEIDATCVRESMLKVGDKVTSFSEIKCKKVVKPVVERTGNPCARGNTEILKIGYEVSGVFLEVYEICYDKIKKLPIYSRNRIRRSLAGVGPNATWFDNILVPYNFDTLYDCNKQINKLSLQLGKWFHRDDKCCFAKRQLVNSRDVSPGLPQSATYSNLNLVPHWSTCASKNWEDVEQRLRTLVKPLDRDLIIQTGISGQLQLPIGSSKSDIYISDEDNKIQSVPTFLWKVVQDESSKSSLAIIQVNVPDLTLSEAYGYMLCRDICGDTEWMRNPGWRDVKKGYTYCCSIKNFESAFGFHGQFSSGMEGILKDILLVPEHSLA